MKLHAAVSRVVPLKPCNVHLTLVGTGLVVTCVIEQSWGEGSETIHQVHELLVKEFEAERQQELFVSIQIIVR